MIHEGPNCCSPCMSEWYTRAPTVALLVRLNDTRGPQLLLCMQNWFGWMKKKYPELYIRPEAFKNKIFSYEGVSGCLCRTWKNGMFKGLKFYIEHFSVRFLPPHPPFVNPILVWGGGSFPMRHRCLDSALRVPHAYFYLSFYLSIYQFVHTFVYQSGYISCLYFNTVYLNICPCVCLSGFLSFWLSKYLSIWLSIQNICLTYYSCLIYPHHKLYPCRGRRATLRLGHLENREVLIG